MTIKTGQLQYTKNENQLVYLGTIGTYDFDLATEVDATTGQNSFTLTWEDLPETYSPLYVKFRVRSVAMDVYSNWSVPQVVYLPVKYDVYKRLVGSVATRWEKIDTVSVAEAGPYQETYDGQVQYAVCISHIDSQLGINEGFGEAPFINPYLLFYTEELDT